MLFTICYLSIPPIVCVRARFMCMCAPCVLHWKMSETINRRISREWRQKIESWLQANEQDEKQSEDYKRRARRLTGNRRSFENDSGIIAISFDSE